MRTFELFFFPELWTNKFGARMPALTLKKMYGKEFAIETQFAENKRGKRVEYLTSGAILLSQAAARSIFLFSLDLDLRVHTCTCILSLSDQSSQN